MIPRIRPHNLLILLLINLSIYSQPSFSKISISTEGMMSYSDSDSSITTSSTRGYDYQLQLGYHTTNNFYIGGLYSGSKETTKSKTSSTATETVAKTELNFMGPSLGYFFQSGIYILGTYYLEASKDQGSETVTTTSEGEGYQAQIGFIAKAAGLKFTISIVYRNYLWKKSAGVAIENETTTTETQPYIGLIFLF